MNPSERPPDKSSYSYKEMMDQLRRQRKKSPSAGTEVADEPGRASQPVRLEVVELPDGRQEVAEVRRKRKRRSHQPKKVKERRVKMIKRALLLGGVPSLVALVGLYFLMISAIKGDRFRVAVSERMSELVGADLAFGSFKLRGMVLSSRKVIAEGDAGGLFREAELLSLKSDVRPSTFFSSDWNLKAVQVTDATFRFGPAGKSTPLGAVGPAEAQQLLLAGLGLDRRPARVDYDGIWIGKSSMYWDSPGRPAKQPFVEGAAVTAGRPIANSVNVRLGGGKLAVPKWPTLGIRVISGEFDDGIFTINQSSLEHLDGGRVNISGGIGLKGKGGYDLAVDYENLEVRDLVHPFWADKLGGEIDGNLSVSGRLTEPASLEASGAFQGRRVVVSNNRILKLVSLGLGEALLARVEFRTFGGRYRRSAERAELYDLKAEDPTLFRLRGNVVVLADGTLEGGLEIGLPESILEKVDGGKPSFFGIADDGFCWTHVALSGLVDDPREDLTPKLEALRIKRLERRIPNPALPAVPLGADQLEESFEKLIQE